MSTNVSGTAINLYLYLLGKNGKTDLARPIVEQLETVGQPEQDKFLDWYSSKFGLNGANHAVPITLSIE